MCTLCPKTNKCVPFSCHSRFLVGEKDSVRSEYEIERRSSGLAGHVSSLVWRFNFWTGTNLRGCGIWCDEAPHYRVNRWNPCSSPTFAVLLCLLQPFALQTIALPAGASPAISCNHGRVDLVANLRRSSVLWWGHTPWPVRDAQMAARGNRERRTDHDGGQPCFHVLRVSILRLF